MHCVLQIDLVFGNSFNINGLGGVITCGTIGIGAGLSHSPVVSLLQAHRNRRFRKLTSLCRLGARSDSFVHRSQFRRSERLCAET